jgi:hypothetical protein
LTIEFNSDAGRFALQLFLVTHAESADSQSPTNAPPRDRPPT